MNEDDDKLWGRFTDGIVPIDRDDVLPPANEPGRAGRRKKGGETSLPEILPVSGAGSSGPAQGFELDKRTEDRLRSGKMPIDGRIDLHGMTQAQAHRALGFFVREAHGAGKRCLLVITGKGRGEAEPEHWMEQESGVLRRRVPEWLGQGDLADKVLKVFPAIPRHGGAGAVYVYLRRVRDTGG